MAQLVVDTQSKLVVIGMADLNVVHCPHKLTTYGLGSCVGVTLFDPATRIGGMAHVMLPQSTGEKLFNRAKFADTALVDLLQAMLKAGASRNGIIAKMAGGAHMFSQSHANDVIKVGQRNAAACKETLKQLRIPLRAEDTGGTYGRTIELHTTNGEIYIKTIGHGEKYI